MQLKPRSTRAIALLTGGIIAATTFVQPVTAHAADKSKNLKYGAIGLGVVGAYLLSKGKTLPAAAAVAGGAYAYKKGRDEQRDNRNDDWRYRNGRNDRDRNDRNRNDRDGYRNGGYDYRPNGNGNGYGGYNPEYRANARYRDGQRNDRDRNDRDRNDRDRNDYNRNDRDRRDNRDGGYDLSPYLR
ncbi:hypothetical protein EON80_08720 [bacterium]|nr:MAG: hypothetical protein EON80_08720 [bacterium]